MVAVRCYEGNGGLVLCDLYCPSDGYFYTQCPTLQGLPVPIPAPETEWDGKTLEGYPVVFAVYRSSRGNSTRSPVVVGVLASAYLEYVNEQKKQDETSEATAGEPPRSPGVRDATMASRTARLILRDEGEAQVHANSIMLRGDSVVVSNGGDEFDSPTVAEPMLEQLVSLGDKINGILEYLSALVVDTPTGPGRPVRPILVPSYFPPQLADIQTPSMLVPKATTGTEGGTA